MLYNLFFRTRTNAFNILGVNDDQLQKVIESYKKGRDKFTISGKIYHIAELFEFKVFSHTFPEVGPAEFLQWAIRTKEAKSHLGNPYLDPTLLNRAGKDITSEVIGDMEFGDDLNVQKSSSPDFKFINERRISELKSSRNSHFDLTKLIRLCEEMNDSYERSNFYCVAMLGRSIINHVPPIFGYKTFNDVANQYGTQSFKKNMNHLNVSMRSIADSFLHETISKKEVTPTSTQVNFSQDMDVLLGAIVHQLNN